MMGGLKLFKHHVGIGDIILFALMVLLCSLLYKLQIACALVTGAQIKVPIWGSFFFYYYYFFILADFLCGVCGHFLIFM